ncbi:carbohydrate ABC transporter permease [Cohnella rhizosphaerae]|uniref:Carbohydrate ABC transporter permease n=1 Tax=Cohnella rhizosphaerae TaxID=1457232 RepID=A0A9X4QXS8_9BACL|nr:carbohydrate ABC transporter permease [Cohnella rhizosphaerae]MDG0813852.1 carbohydrate ABC transporter permease [Cohnella rhizosphaerae]
MRVAGAYRYAAEAVMLLFSLVFVIPVWMVVVNSIKSQKEAAFFGIGWPSRFSFENYATVFKEANIADAFLNGLFYCAVIIVFSVLFSSMGAFAIARMQTRLTEFSYYLFLSGIILPGAIIPTYFMLQKMGLVGTYYSVIVVLLSQTMPIGVFLYTGFMKTVPREMDEAAIIDGAGKLRMFFSVIFPLLTPVTMSLVIFNFMGVWNDVVTQIYFVDASKWTMPMMVYRFQGMYISKWNLIFADLVLTSIPVILIYLFGQRYMVSGITQGAVKA